MQLSATLSELLVKDAQHVAKCLPDLALRVANLVDSVNIGEFLRSFLFQYDRLGEAKPSLKEADLVNDVLTGSDCTVFHSIFARHDENSEGTCAEQFADDVANSVAGSRASLIGDDLVPVLVLKVVFQIAPLFRRPMSNEYLGLGWGRLWFWWRGYEAIIRQAVDENGKTSDALP